jgi:hypothetical protein
MPLVEGLPAIRNNRSVGNNCVAAIVPSTNKKDVLAM